MPIFLTRRSDISYSYIIFFYATSIYLGVSANRSSHGITATSAKAELTMLADLLGKYHSFSEGTDKIVHIFEAHHCH